MCKTKSIGRPLQLQELIVLEWLLGSMKTNLTKIWQCKNWKKTIIQVQYDYNMVEFNTTIEEKSRELLPGHICWRVCVFVKFVKKLCAALEKVRPDFFYGGDDIMIMQAYFVDYVRKKFSYISYIMY